MNVLDSFKLDGKIALVTGCRRGIGKAMTLALAEAGADIIGVSASLEAGSGVEREVQSLGRRFMGYACDLSNREALYGFIRQVKADFPVIDILVSNAGIVARNPALEHTDEQWDQVMEVNVNSQFILSREIGRDMVARGSGKIIFTASMTTFQGGINLASYATSKGGIAQLAKALSNEWAGSGVQVNALAPGYIRTDINQAVQDDAERFGAILSRIPAGRWGESDDLKGAIVFLASAASNYVSGSVMTVDGGWLGR
jgi:2-deoxy-D-gluconate 3-dehydrogenase